MRVNSIRHRRILRRITYYGNYDTLRQQLKDIDVDWMETDVYTTFWGKEFTIFKPKGKGAVQKTSKVWSL